MTLVLVVRTREGKEVDFALINNGKIESLIEVKNQNATPSKSLSYFHKKYNLPAVQLVRHLEQESQSGNIQIRSAVSYLSGLFL